MLNNGIDMMVYRGNQVELKNKTTYLTETSKNKKELDWKKQHLDNKPNQA
jgi:hypothetical protein